MIPLQIYDSTKTMMIPLVELWWNYRGGITKIVSESSAHGFPARVKAVNAPAWQLSHWGMWIFQQLLGERGAEGRDAHKFRQRSATSDIARSLGIQTEYTRSNLAAPGGPTVW
jgi:hypothetical protein